MYVYLTTAFQCIILTTNTIDSKAYLKYQNYLLALTNMLNNSTTNSTSNSPSRDILALNLLKQTAEGQRPSFQKLYQLTNRQVYTYLNRFLCDKNATDEVLAATYVEVWRSARRYQGSYRVCIWILLIARAKAKRKLKQLMANNKQIPTDNPENVDKQKLLFLAMSSLPPHHRELLGLALMPEFTYQEIAKLMNIQVGTAKSRVLSAKNALFQTLAQLGEA